MEILAAYDLTGSFRSAGELAGCSHHTVAAHVRARDEGRPWPVRTVRAKVTDPYLPKIEEWVEQSKGKIRADKAFKRLKSLGYPGSERATRRAVALVKAAWRLGHVRVHRPWVTEPGMWLQYDFGDGPRIDGTRTTLFVAWLAYSRYRIVIPLRDRTAPSVYAALDRSFRLLEGAPTHVLTDNERMVTTDHVAGVPVRNKAVLDFAKHYSVTVLTCQPADPASKGGVEAAVKLAKDDIVPKATNLREEYGSFADLEAECRDFMTKINAKEHRVTRRRPADMLLDEQSRLHRIPEEPHTVAFGLSRTVPENTPMVTFENGQYSVPAYLLGQKVFTRAYGAGRDAQVIIVHIGKNGPVEVARHGKTFPGHPAIQDDHFPGHPGTDKTPGTYEPRPRTLIETEFLRLGDGAKAWLLEAAAAGTERLVNKMSDAIGLAKIAGTSSVDRALGVAAIHGRFGANDLLALLAAGATEHIVHAADEAKSLTQGTSAWNRLTTANGNDQANLDGLPLGNISARDGGTL